MLVEARKYIRHPSDIPLSYTLEKEASTVYVRDVSEGGLCFISNHRVGTGQKIHIVIPIVKPEFDADGIVCWCKTINNAYLVGVSFQDKAIAYAIRMIEQVCHIEHYRMEALNQKGIELSSEQAAREWITHYAEDFPNSEN